MLAQAQPGPKDGPAWLPADIDPGPRTATRARSWSTMVMDIEAHASTDATGIKTVDGPEPPPLDAMADEIRDIGWRAHLHTSHTHLDPEIRPLDQDHARYRIVFALDRPLLAPEIKPLLEHLARVLGVSDAYDKGCFNADRLFYLPRAPAERLALFQSRTIEGEPLPVDRLLADAQREAEAIRREAGKRAAAPEPKRNPSVSVQNPSSPTGADVIRAFNDVHDIGALLERHGYLPKGRGRWLSPQSSSGAPGVRLLSETSKIISSHDDALNDGHVHDAFDVFKILEHGGNQTAAIRAASKLLGMDRKRAATASEEKAKRSQAHGKNMGGSIEPPINALSHEEPPPAPHPGPRAANDEPPPIGEESYPWPDPGDISSPADALPYPLHVFPPIARQAIEEYIGFGQQPPPLVASAALAQMAIACHGLADVARDDYLVSPISLYLLLVAMSGERKSAADKQFSRALRAWVREQRDARMPAWRQSVAMASAHKARLEGKKSRIKSLAPKDDDASKEEIARLEKEIVELEQNPIVTIPLPAAAYEDVNPASLAYAVATGWPSSGLFSDEAGAVIGSQGLGDENATSLLSLLNILWDGRDFIPTRKQAQVAEIRGRRFACFLMLQPDLLPKLIEKGARNLGFLARFLIAAPESTMGTRLYREPPATWAALDDFDRQITRLLNTDLPIDRSGEDRGARMLLDPPIMRLDPAAKTLWVEFYNEVERELVRFGEYSAVQDIASKTAENAVRIAAIFKLFDQGRVGRTVEAEYVAGGIAVAGWHLTEARRVFLEADTPQEIQDARELSAWLSGKGRELANSDGEPLIDREGFISVREIAIRGPNRVRDTVRRDDALDLLVEAAHVRRCDIGKRKRLQINPNLLTRLRLLNCSNL
ncbi:YfjI family protein [uncultured Thiocystis sp.]|uniref:YfjI family protein n=1 Tax=uncultured Thiocystis sp. TaxID=1202134 RepID=UPI0025F9A266|nr:YfjI family protein [uncultured Thiocystis sp.]